MDTNKQHSSKQEKIRSLMERMMAIGESPELKERAEWREYQRKVYKEMGMTPEEIEEEIIG